MRVQRFEDLKVWQASRELSRLIYRLCAVTTLGRDYRLRDQVTAASVSVMNNIAEGFDSHSDPEFIRFLTYSRRSCSEVQNCLYVAQDQGHISQDVFQEHYVLAETVRRMIDGLIRYLKDSNS